MIRHTHQIGGVTVNFSVGRLDDMPRCATCGRALCGCTDTQFKIPAPRSPIPADGNGSEAHAAEATNGCGTTGHFSRECVGMPTGAAISVAAPNYSDWFASIPSFGRDWPAGVLSFHGEPYV